MSEISIAKVGSGYAVTVDNEPVMSFQSRRRAAQIASKVIDQVEGLLPEAQSLALLSSSDER